MMRNMSIGKWVAAAVLGTALTAGLSAQTVQLRPRNQDPQGQNRPDRAMAATLSKEAQAAVDKAAADFKKLPVEQRMSAVRELQRALMVGLTPEERAKLGPPMGPGPRGGQGMRGPDGQRPGWGGRRGMRGPNGQPTPPPPPPPPSGEQGTPPPATP